jgi:hypothetical protein
VNIIVNEVRTFLQRHPHKAYRPVPIAQAIGEADIRRVRAALHEMRDAGELVHCTVEVPGQGFDKEFRLIAGGVAMKINPMTGDPQRPRRRGDTSGIPSRMLDLPKSERPREGEVVIEYPDVPAVIAPVAIAAAPPADKVSAPAVKIEIPKFVQEDTPKVEFPKARGLQNGKIPARQRQIVNYIEAADRRVTASELLDHFREFEPAMPNTRIANAIGKAIKRGWLVKAGQIAEPCRDHSMMMSYATPAIATRLSLYSIVGRGAVPASTTPAPAPRESPLAPLEVEILERNATKERATQTPVRDARVRLESFFKEGDGNWFGLPWLVRVAGGDVPATLEAIASLQLDRRLAYAEADRAPIWRAVEGRW